MNHNEETLEAENERLKKEITYLATRITGYIDSARRLTKENTLIKEENELYRAEYEPLIKENEDLIKVTNVLHETILQEIWKGIDIEKIEEENKNE